MTFKILLTTLLVCIPSFFGTALQASETDVQKAVLITGASSGIGRTTAEHLAKAGYFVYAGARKDADIESLNQIDNVMALRLDVTKQDEIDLAVKAVESGGRGLWGIVNNAGVNVVAPMIEATEEQLDFVFAVNVYGVFRTTKAFAPLVIASKGRIVNISSISGVLSGYGYGMYAMSKHAIEAYTDSLAREMEDLDVFVAAIEPGNYRSQIGVTRCERLLADVEPDPYRYFADYQQKRREQCREWLDEGAPNESPDPLQVAVAVEHALFNERPKDHYLVVPRQVEAGWTIMKAMEEVLMLNGGHQYSYSQEELVALMKAFWPYTTGEKSFYVEADEEAFSQFAEAWLSKGEAAPEDQSQ